MKIGIIGLGTVGEGVLKIIEKEKEKLISKSNQDIEVKYACDIDINKNFDFEFDKNILIDDYNIILNDPEVEIVIELIGGITTAKQITTQALKAKKNVVTANKALISKYGSEILNIAKENGVYFLYEAAVGGGIPIITPLKESLIANKITEITGIINGTSNYILTKMKEERLSFDEALKLASEKGYAEADPSFDIDGIDAGHKIDILSALSYGGFINFEDIYIEGIRNITLIDIFESEKIDYVIKLIASSKLLDNDKIEISVEPTLIHKSELLSNVNGIYNAIEIIGSYTGKSLFYGQGAGMDPTASAVVADIVKIASDTIIEGEYFFDTTHQLSIIDNDTIKSNYYVRTSRNVEIEGLSYNYHEIIDNYSLYIFENISKKELIDTFKDDKDLIILRIYS